MEGPYRFALQCVCKIERLFSVNVIRSSCLEVATSARVWMGAIVLVLACELAPAAYASEGCSSSASGEPAAEASADASALSEAAHPKNGWEYDAASNQWFYYQNSAPAKGWLYTGGFWYWFDNEGVMAVGLTECAGGRYLLNAGDDASIPYGAMRLGWVACDDGWRFFNASGAMERCWLLDGSNWYWLDPETGIMATSATQCGSGSYCFGASGAMAFGWAYDRGTWYYADSSGELQSGWLHKWGAWYWLDPSTKAMATGLVNDGSSLYAMGASGAMQTGWALVDGAWYHAAESGVLDAGWYWGGSHWYWLDPGTRAMATGEFEAYGDHYYALTDGAIQVSGWAPCGEGLALLRSNGAVIFVAGKNASGAPVVQSGAQSTVRGDSWEQTLPGFFSVDGKTFYANADGELQSGWVRIGDSHYFFDSDYAMQTGWYWDGSSWYWLDSDGSMATGWRSISGSWYFFDDSGAMATGWKQCGEAWYFFRSLGSMETGWLSWGGAWYYLDSSGAMQTGWLHYGSAWYWLDEATGRMASSGWYDCDGTCSWFNASGVWVDASGSVLGVSRQRLLEQLISHENDSYYLGTRYDTSLSPVCCTYPNGEPRSDGFTGMNCGGFVSHAYAKAGGDLSKIANDQSNSPWPGGPGRGSFCNAYRWYGYALDSGATVLQFNSVSELLASGEARKGDLVFFYPFNPYSTDCHIGFFWGDTPYENRFWHSFGGMGNSISEFVSDGPSWVILMR